MNKLIDFLNKNSNNNNCLKKIPVAATAETYITQLLDLFVPNNEVNYTIIKNYKSTIDNYTFNVFCCLFNDQYSTFLNILTEKELYSNILRKNFKMKNRLLSILTPY